MKRPDFNGPWIAVALLLLAAIGGAFYANPDNVLELGHWSPAAHWGPAIHWIWDGTGAAFLTLALGALLASAFFSALSWPTLGLALAIALIAMAGSGELLLLGGGLLLGPLFVAKRAGVWAASSLVALFLVILGLSGVFGTSDLRECLRLSLEPYDFPAAAAERTSALLGVCVLTLAVALAWAPLRLRAVGIVACGLLSARLAFLSTVAGRSFPMGSRPAFLLTALALVGVFALAYYHAQRGTAYGMPKAPSKPWRQWNAGVEQAVSWLEDGFWPGLWRVPVQFVRTLGLFFDYWQGGTPQYTLLVLLLGTLVLFWAALKTQVIW